MDGPPPRQRPPASRSLRARRPGLSELPRALFWSALARANGGNRPLGIRRLQQAKDLEPSFEGPWKVLADIYRFERRRPELSQLKTEYQTRFGQPLG